MQWSQYCMDISYMLLLSAIVGTWADYKTNPKSNPNLHLSLNRPHKKHKAKLLYSAVLRCFRFII